jgi:hypothetical protein
MDADIVPQSAYGIIPLSILKNIFILNRLTIATKKNFRTSGVCWMGNIFLWASKGGIFFAVNHYVSM